MIKLERYELDFSRGIEYLKSNLENTNKLSSMVIKSVCFKSGRFFTLLPNNTNINNINEFLLAGIAINVRNQVNDIIFNKLRADNRLICIFDDVTTDFRLEYRDPLFLSCGLVCEKEIYYLVTMKNASRELINQCFRASNAIWHSLCILTKYKLNENKKLIDLSEMKEVCLNAELILAGAYDGEGYVFWENSTNEFLNANDKEIQNSKFTWNDSVTISKSAPRQFHPGEIGLICGMSRIEFEEIALKYRTKMGSWIYTVEFKDGSDIEIAECFLEKYYNGF